MDIRMAELRAKHSRENTAQYREFFEKNPQFANQAYEDQYWTEELDSAYVAFVRQSGIIERQAAERAELAAVIRAEKAE